MVQNCLKYICFSNLDITLLSGRRMMKFRFINKTIQPFDQKYTNIIKFHFKAFFSVASLVKLGHVMHSQLINNIYEMFV